MNAKEKKAFRYLKEEVKSTSNLAVISILRRDLDLMIKYIEKKGE